MCLAFPRNQCEEAIYEPICVCRVVQRPSVVFSSASLRSSDVASPSFLRMCMRTELMLLGVLSRMVAISKMVLPPMIRRPTSRSVGVSEGSVAEMSACCILRWAILCSTALIKLASVRSSRWLKKLVTSLSVIPPRPSCM